MIIYVVFIIVWVVTLEIRVLLCLGCCQIVQIKLNAHLLFELGLLKGTECVGNDCENESLLSHTSRASIISVAVLSRT